MNDLNFLVRPARADEAALYARFARALWRDCGEKECLAEGENLLSSPHDGLFFAERASEPVGFAHVSLRFEYVEGAESSPTGYLEGIYVVPSARHGGIARALLRACETWAREKGVDTFASDCEQSNAASQMFHRAMGFSEANRIICYIKPLTGGIQL